MDLKNSPKSLLKGLSKVLLDSSKVLEEAHQSYSATDDLESIDDENDILERANEIQKAAKRKVKVKKAKRTLKGEKLTSQKKDEDVLITVCRVNLKGENYVGVKSSSLEILAKRSDSYEMFAGKAASKVGLDNEANKTFHLFTWSGARILNEQILINEKARPWTLGNYLCLLRKSADNVKLGVGLIPAQKRPREINSSFDQGPSARKIDQEEGEVPKAASVSDFSTSSNELKPPPTKKPCADHQNESMDDIPDWEGYEKYLRDSWDFEKPVVLSIELEELIDVESFSAKPIGPISEHIPDGFHQLIPPSFASSYVVNSYEDSAKLRELLSVYKQPQPAIIVYHYQDDPSIANASYQNNLVVKKLLKDHFGDSFNCDQLLDNIEESQSASSGDVYQVREFSEDDINKSTENFSPSRELGHGGFGTVYKGYINGTNIAVKVLSEGRSVAEAVRDRVDISDKYKTEGQLDSELRALTRCRHKNLVDLVGYCSKPPAVVYEFMDGGNLHDRMFEGKGVALSWRQRSIILKDVCRGLSWLHAANPPVIHGDVKMTNVLLDHHLHAKLGDFGLSQEFVTIAGGRSVITRTSVAKTLGYGPPEMDTGHVSPKSDMYSYGVLVLETFTRVQAYSKDREDPKLTDYFDDQRSTIEGYGIMADKAAGELAPYLLKLYRDMTEGCLLKHSKRLNSAQVMEQWDTTNF